MFKPVLLLAVFMLGACSEKRVWQLDIFYGDAQQCLFNVNEGLTYEKSPNCRHLKTSWAKYAQARKKLNTENDQDKLRSQEAQTMAWKARVISLTQNKEIEF